MMNKTPLISIIVPVYNVEKYISKCIESLCNQTYKNIEILVINDGSTDNTAQILSSFENENRIRVIHQKNQGVAFSRNIGIAVSKGEYICFVDGDDYVSEQYCEKLYKNLIENEADISVCRFFKVINGKQEQQHLDKSVEVYSQMEALSLIFEDKKLQSHPWGKLFKRNVIENITFPTHLKAFEDYVTVYRIIEQCNRIVLFDEPLYHYIFYADSLSNNTNPQMYTDFFTALITMYDFAKRYQTQLPRWRHIVEKTARQTLYCIKNIAMHRRKGINISQVEKMKEDIYRFYIAEKKYIPKSMKWKFFLLFKSPSLYNIYVNYKKIR